MGSDLGFLIDPFRIFSTATKMVTGKSMETWTGINAAKDKENASAASTEEVSSGDLTDEEIKKASSSRLFRIGSFFSSPTGVLNSSSRRGTKLIGN